MDLNAILEKIKTCVWLIPENRFDDLTKDKGYVDSFIYFLIITALSIPVVLISSFLNPSGLMVAVFAIPMMFVLGIPLSYVGFLILFALLKLFGGKADLLKTIQVFIYGGTSSTIFGGLPIIGIVPGVVSLINIVKGAARVHQMQWWKVVIAIIVIPLIVLTIVIVVVGMYFTTLKVGLIPVPK